MTTSDTPETDAMVEESFHRINFPTAPVPAEFARKLERERNEWAAMCGRYKQERDEAHKIAEQAIEDLAWFNETNSQRLRTELENEMKWHHRTHKELIEAQCKLLDIEYDKLKS